MWQFLCARVDGSTNICNFKFASIKTSHSGDDHGKVKSKMARVGRRARRVALGTGFYR